MVRFRPNWAQEELFHGLWFRNTILKVRQLGISTFCAVYMLDLCLFGKNQHCGIIDKTLEDGEAKLRKIAFAYEHLDYLPESPTMEDRALAALGKMVKEGCAVVEKRATRMAWSTNGSVDVGVNLRGSTLQFLHISEFSYTALHDPARARKIRTGALNTVGKSCVVVMESTHEGGEGRSGLPVDGAGHGDGGQASFQPGFQVFLFFMDPASGVLPGGGGTEAG